MNNIAPLALERAIQFHRSELPADDEVLQRLWRYLETTRPLMAEIKASVCEFYDIHAAELVGDDRDYEITRARQVFCYLAYRYTRRSLHQIGQYINRDHSTVHHAVRRIEKWMVTRPLLEDHVDLLRLRISEKMMERRAAQC